MRYLHGYNHRANNKESLLSSDGLAAREFKDRADDDRELEVEVVKVLYGATAGERMELPDLHFSGQPKAHEMESERFGWWLYSHVATRTTKEPMMNVKVIWKSKRATDARKEMTMLRLVANPLRILSEYLMTRAVSRPPNTCTHTVPHAHPPKLRNRVDPHPSCGSDAYR